jgi:hypothetical protein
MTMQQTTPAKFCELPLRDGLISADSFVHLFELPCIQKWLYSKEQKPMFREQNAISGSKKQLEILP